jgi:hypothetical protein
MFVNRVVKKKLCAASEHLCSWLFRGSSFSFQPPGYTSSPITLVEFCIQHPKASFRLHHPFWCQESSGFLLLGLVYAAAICEHRLIDHLIRDQRPWLNFDLTGIKSTLPKEGVPLNFRLVPFEESIDRDTLCEYFRECSFSLGRDSSVWLDLVEDWFVKGL